MGKHRGSPDPREATGANARALAEGLTMREIDATPIDTSEERLLEDVNLIDTAYGDPPKDEL